MKSAFLFRGANVAYSIKGKGQNVLFIHGFLGSKEVWNSYQKRFSKNYRVIAVDLAGHGNSDCIGYVHTMELFADSIHALLKHLNIKKSFIIGHSLGGYVALAFAEKFPDSVSGLCMMNSSAKGDDQYRLKSRDQLIELVKSDKERALELLIPGFFNLKKRNTHWHIKKYLKLAGNCTERGIIATIEGMKIRKEREIVLKFAPFPYSFIIGEKDSILKSEVLIEESKLNENGIYYLVENTSHMGYMEAEEKVFGLLKRFLKNK